MVALVPHDAFEDEWQDIMEDLQSSAPAARLQGVKELARIGYGADEAAGLLDDPSTEVRIGAIRAVGNSGIAGIEYLRRLQEKAKRSSLEPKERVAAIQAIGTLGAATGSSDMLEPLLEDVNPDIVAAACVALGSTGPATVSQKLIEKLSSVEVVVIVGAVQGLATLQEATDAIVKLAKHADSRVRAAVLEGLCATSSTTMAKHLGIIVEGLGSDSFVVRAAALRCLQKLGPDAAAAQGAQIAKLLTASSPGVRCAALMALASLGQAVAAHAGGVEKLLEDEGKDEGMLVMHAAGLEAKVEPGLRKVCCAAAVAVGSIKIEAAASSLSSRLASTMDEELKMCCLDALAGLGTEGARHQEVIEALLEDSAPLVVAAALHALGELAVATFPSANAAMKVAEFLNHSHPAVKEAAAVAMSHMDSEATPYVELIVKLLADVSEKVQVAAIGALAGAGEMGEMYAADVVRRMFSPSLAVRLCAIESMAKMTTRGPAYTDELVSILQEPYEAMRLAALNTLKAFGTKALKPYEVEIAMAKQECSSQVGDVVDAILADLNAQKAAIQGDSES
mmetsp:Transcript_35694/g.83547  ORF Transcript_35694/g.83547 Transcript_35694/m.83547 type:complete len:565 (+) Transcript_35694:69-1763(+)